MGFQDPLTTRRQRLVVPMDGLDRHGAAVLTERLLALPGVITAYASATTEMAYVIFDRERVCVVELIATMEQAGFRPGPLGFRYL